MAEGVVGGQEEPGITAILDHRAPGAVGQHPGVEEPVHSGSRAVLAREVGAAGSRVDVGLSFFARDLVDRQGDRRHGHVDDHVDAFGVEPLARGDGAHVGLVLVAGRYHFHLEARLAGFEEVLGGHLGGRDRARSRNLGERAGHVVHDTDTDHVVRYLGLGTAQTQHAGGGQRRANHLSLHRCVSFG
ncbi:hypothetical protein D3C85_1251520 [compost metagenome]